jgi:hypothetical protein
MLPLLCVSNVGKFYAFVGEEMQEGEEHRIVTITSCIAFLNCLRKNYHRSLFAYELQFLACLQTTFSLLFAAISCAAAVAVSTECSIII